MLNEVSTVQTMQQVPRADDSQPAGQAVARQVPVGGPPRSPGRDGGERAGDPLSPPLFVTRAAHLPGTPRLVLPPLSTSGPGDAGAPALAPAAHALPLPAYYLRSPRAADGRPPRNPRGGTHRPAGPPPDDGRRGPERAGRASARSAKREQPSSAADDGRQGPRRAGAASARSAEREQPSSAAEARRARNRESAEREQPSSAAEARRARNRESARQARVRRLEHDVAVDAELRELRTQVGALTRQLDLAQTVLQATRSREADLRAQLSRLDGR